ncbi:MAG: winged helix-turn-helix domain-containing protein [Promethearchaeota archaeon]
MTLDEKMKLKEEVIDEEEIFKSLSHKIRRDIIKIVGNENGLTFSSIQKQIGAIDSPALSYHLKSLTPLLNSKESEYKLSYIGKAAFNLLSKTDQSHVVSKYRKRFIYAYLATVACWLIAQTLTPIFLNLMGPDCRIPIFFFAIQFSLTVVAFINYILIWQLKKI